MEGKWSGEERRQNPMLLQEELKAVRHDVGRLASAVATLGSDERMQEVIDAVVEEEKRHRQRLLTKVVIGLVVLGAIGITNLSLTNRVKNIAVDSKTVAGYVDHCLVHPTLAKPGECGNVSGQQSASVKAIFCVLLVAPLERTPKTVEDCYAKALDGIAATTTTTR